jgi:hypothetical protein
LSSKLAALSQVVFAGVERQKAAGIWRLCWYSMGAVLAPLPPVSSL